MKSIESRLASIRRGLKRYDVYLSGELKLRGRQALSSKRLRDTILRYEWLGRINPDDLLIQETHDSGAT